jgi:hypothetical protein
MAETGVRRDDPQRVGHEHPARVLPRHPDVSDAGRLPFLEVARAHSEETCPLKRPALPYVTLTQR